MSGNLVNRVFVDTNVLVYTVSGEKQKQPHARALVAQVPEVVISAQVLSEFTNVCLRQRLLSLEEIEPIVTAWMQAYEVVPVEAATIRTAYRVKRRYGYSWWDCVMLAAALEASCEVLYTEDLHEGQEIDGQLCIENPFT